MLLQVKGLEVQYGKSRILHGVGLELADRPLAVVGRNGMGKSTLCNAIMGMAPITGGSVRFDDCELVGQHSYQIARRGVALVPQGRRIFPSLTVEEHLRLVERPGLQKWTRERVYDEFPRLFERRRNDGAALSGGEQQMLAIARALLCNPRLLIMDEPTEGLAPLMVEQIVTTLKGMADEGEIALLLIEQNLGVALEVADSVAVMVNGRIERILKASELAADRSLQQRFLGVSAGADAEVC
ncbi:MAG: ABC transporter ATP-binding protein [Gammaproteobacteria bacterium]|nr:ABC transporter ATP-binding protein [Rhodocyclaceae bacterium]MBU3907796.1 ABC transporter ATP-binding protein [Gammaproteobacteria bacterium]MBU3989973.1 ABC transporter ATP-binding protein [Gammaproteobacteria bacterium]MBU4004442.1 ABC transporter ATP-binding protein [Gammaproteobacteria bacterium]MBU4019851.1 ABC transporter ATP-binding protein [Gammaproteobacteria bacterium]